MNSTSKATHHLNAKTSNGHLYTWTVLWI